MKFDLRVSGVNDVKRSLHKYSVETNKKLHKEVSNTTLRIHKDARLGIAVDTGMAREKVDFTVGHLAGLVWSGASYSLDIERGQEPGRWPDLEILKGWVRRKLGVKGSRLRGVTFLVARKIYRKGTKAQPFFEPAVTKNKTRFFNRTRRVILDSKL